MRITDIQHSLLAGLECVRLSSSEAHKELIDLIANKRNAGLVKYLRAKGWQEDVDGSTAFYVVKDSGGEILLFFSLKCGALFRHLDEKQIKEQKQFYELAKQVILSPESEKDKEIATLILDKFRRSGFISDNDKRVLKKLKSAKGKLAEVLNAISDDRQRDPNEHIIRVSSTHSGVELVHLCANDNVRAKWDTFGFPHSLGKVMFWKFVIPIVEEVRKLVGCKYLFLFAADSTEDFSLVNYYEVDLHFERPNHIGTSKPQYDFNCVFMCQEIDRLVRERILFFENFNPDPTEELV